MKKQSQYERVLEYCRQNATISSYEAFTHLRVTRLAAVIFYLERRGYIFDHIMWHDTNKEGEPIRYMIYRLKNNGK